MLKGYLRRMGDDKGSIAAITALLMPILIGGLALSVDTAYWRYRSSVLQTAADTTALSLAMDINNSITAVVTLNANAVSEAGKNGCASSCSVALVYPYNADANSVSVTLTDTNALRFFSGIYSTSSKTLSARASSKVSSGGTGSGSTRQGSGCILAKMSTPPSGSGRGIEVNGSTTIITGCEVISNATGATSIFGDAGGQITSLATAVGSISMNNGAIATTPHPNQPALVDPYAAAYINNNAANPLRRAQFGSGYVAPTALQVDCMENVVSGNINTIDWTVDQTTNTNSNKLFNPALHTYTTSIGSDGRRIVNMGGGGGVFCSDFSATNTVFNLGPGVWYFLRSMLMSNSVINATSNSSSSIIPLSVPSVGGQMTNGITLVLSDNNFGATSGSELHLRAPNMGPLSGIAFTDFTDLGGNFVEFANNSLVELGGTMYLPQRYLRIQNNGRFYSLAGPDGTAATGCSQLVAGSISFLNNVVIRNNCAGYGLTPFGTDSTSGWYVVAGTGSGIKGRLIP